MPQRPEQPPPGPHELIANGEWEQALFTTYALSLTFFETHILKAGLIRNGCQSIWVVADVDGYQQSLTERQSARVGQEYHLVPVALPDGVFHPKCIYLAGPSGDVLLVGSGNLTFGGFGRNVEVIEALTAAQHPSAFHAFGQYLQALAARKNFLNPEPRWLSIFSDLAFRASRGVTTPPAEGPHFLHCVTSPIADQLADHFATAGGASRLRILSPFYDHDVTSVRDLAAKADCKRVAIGLLPGREEDTTFPFNLPPAGQTKIEAALVSADEDARPLHAKWLEADLKDGRRLTLVGSVNATRKEKVESLFLWGHQLENPRGVPGVRSTPAEFREEKANLSFESWNRDATNTSLRAGVQYGPSLSDRIGLGFLRQVEGEFYQVTARGEALAKALDERLRRRSSYRTLIDLRSMYASPADAKDLFPAWRTDTATAEEQIIFREAFFNESAPEKDSPMGRRSAIIRLIRLTLQHSRRPISEDEIRKRIAYQRLPSGKKHELPDGLRATARKWLALQVRQGQRLALESIMAWVEYRLLNKGDRDARKLAAAAVGSIRKSSTKALHRETPEAILSAWLGRFNTPDDYVEAAREHPEDLCLFKLGEDLETAVVEDPEDIRPWAFKLLMLSRRFYQWLSAYKDLRSDMAHGQTQRISIAFWAKVWDKNCKYPLISLATTLLNNLILSQHFAVATNRYEGETQRLRITLEEDGLEALVAELWQPYVAADRLRTLLSLIANCGILHRQPNDAYSADVPNRGVSLV